MDTFSPWNMGEGLLRFANTYFQRHTLMDGFVHVMDVRELPAL